MSAETFTIGTLAKRAGVGVQTVRYYERIGLMPKPARPRGTYRHYDEVALAQLRFIRHAAQLGFSLAETQELLALKAKRGAPCAAVRDRAEEKLLHIERKLHELLSLRDAVARLVSACSGEAAVEHCSILAALEEPARETAKGNERCPQK